MDPHKWEHRPGGAGPDPRFVTGVLHRPPSPWTSKYAPREADPGVPAAPRGGSWPRGGAGARDPHGQSRPAPGKGRVRQSGPPPESKDRGRPAQTDLPRQRGVRPPRKGGHSRGAPGEGEMTAGGLPRGDTGSTTGGEGGPEGRGDGERERVTTRQGKRVGEGGHRRRGDNEGRR